MEYDALFYDGSLTAASYGRWLSDHAVRFVAVPRAEPDFSARAELRVIASRPPYLRPVWSARDWRVYEVTVPHSLGPVTRLGRDWLELAFARPGNALVRVRWTPFWRVDGGCAEPAREWTRVSATRAGRVRMTVDMRGDRCD
jgi:hypothetical protein